MHQRTYKVSAIHCFGDHDHVLRYDLSKNKWTQHPFSAKSAFKGEFKYTAVSRVGKTCDIVITGGCHTLNHKASNKAFRLNTEDKEYCFSRMALMIDARYGHSQIYSNGYVFVLGGFNHDDEVGN